MRIKHVLMLLALTGAAGPASALDPVVDQQCVPEIWGLYSIPLGAPMGQEFVPSATALTFVDLWVVNNPSSLDDTAWVYVVIHADSLGGPELGTSGDVFIPKPWDGEARFPFPAAVPLTPGRVHVIEARSHGPGNPLLAEGDQFDVCPGVRGYFLGSPFGSGRDFWHRTGADLAPVTRTSWGRLKLRSARY